MLLHAGDEVCEWKVVEIGWQVCDRIAQKHQGVKEQLGEKTGT